ncbi:MAG: glycosyltransferase [Coriobacteriales bacterium]|jgi:glycosyltransferase involved in cell wall biosynthesis|nr:glycosyltransferase [Coriobacteriales bacterium]
MTKELLLITKTFPFKTGEEFIENEIPYLADAFDKVVVLAVAARTSDEQTRVVPANVQVVAADIPEVSKLSLLLPLTEAEASLKVLRGERDMQAQRFHPERWLYFRYFIRKVRDIQKAIDRLFSQGIFSVDAPPLIYSFWFHDTVVAALLAQEQLGLNMPIVARAHRYDLWEDVSPTGYHPLRMVALKRISRVFPISHRGAAYLKQRFPEYSAKVEAAYLGTVDNGLGFYEAQGNERDSFTVVSCANLIPLKRVDLLVEALALLESSTSVSLRWIHFGSGGQENKIRELAQKVLKKTDWTLRGQIPNAQLMEFYRTHPVDVFVSASASEGLPVTMMEAISFGIPVVATAVGSVDEIVIDGSSGMTLPPDVKPEDIAQVLLSLAQCDLQEYRALRKKARILWEKNFSAQKNYPTFISELYGLLQGTERV